MASKIIKHIFILFIVCALKVFAERSDIFVLQNDDRITGEVKKLEYGRLTFKTDDMGTLLIEWEKISQITTNDKFKVELQDGAPYFGTLNESPFPMRVRIQQNGSFQDIFLWQIVRLRRSKISLSIDSVEFVKDFTRSITYHYSFDNKPVSENAAKQDWDIFLGVGYSL